MKLSFSFLLAGFILLSILTQTKAAKLKEGIGSNILKGKVAVYSKSGAPKTDNSNVVVFLDELEFDTVFLSQASQHNPAISQKGKVFNPEVLPVMAGTTVDFPNNDNIFHNVFSLSKPKPFDLGVYGESLSKSVTFDQPGLVKIYCNIHPEMIAYILVLNNPYFALTDQEGNYTISGIPDGNYTVRAWQRFGPEKTAAVSVSGSSETRINFQLSEEKVSIKHTNKWGKDYPNKY